MRGIRHVSTISSKGMEALIFELRELSVSELIFRIFSLDVQQFLTNLFRFKANEKLQTEITFELDMS